MRKPKPTAEQREISRLNTLIQGQSEELRHRQNDLQRMISQAANTSRYIDNLKTDHVFELERLAARNSALEFGLVMAHQRESQLATEIRRLERRLKGGAALTVDQAASAAAGEPVNVKSTWFEQPNVTAYKRVGDRWVTDITS